MKFQFYVAGQIAHAQDSQCYSCQAQGPDHVQVNSRRLQGLLRLKDIL